LQHFEKRIVHRVDGISPRMCGSAFMAVEYRMGIVQATKGAQLEVQ
jgi:hypothetical protein